MLKGRLFKPVFIFTSWYKATLFKRPFLTSAVTNGTLACVADATN